jgi:twitching motility two-component system response regulator PilH
VGTIRVVVAEPDVAERRHIVEVVQAAARDVGVEVSVAQAGDGTTALALCGDHRPRLLVAEVMLEGLSGLALMRRVRAEFGGKTAVIFVTEMGRETDRYWGLRNGAHAYLAKPFDEASLRDRVRRVLTKGPDAQRDRPG